jgi:hypothetical protein
MRRFAVSAKSHLSLYLVLLRGELNIFLVRDVFNSTFTGFLCTPIGRTDTMSVDDELQYLALSKIVGKVPDKIRRGFRTWGAHELFRLRLAFVLAMTGIYAVGREAGRSREGRHSGLQLAVGRASCRSREGWHRDRCCGGRSALEVRRPAPPAGRPMPAAGAMTGGRRHDRRRPTGAG